jgi:SET domain-containing protein
MPTKQKRAKGTTRAAQKRKSTTRSKRTLKQQHVAKPSPPGEPGPVNEWLELRRSPINGLGAFSIAPIPKGTRVIEYAGEKINNAEADRRYDDESMPEHHTFLFILTSRTCVDAAYDGNEARFINHSCDPNCETMVDRNRVWIKAIKDIPPGVELTYDYMYDDDPAYTAKDYLFYRCQCGAANCRGTIVKTRRKWRS